MSTINITQKAILTPTIDAQFKHLRSYGTTELKSAVYIDAYDEAQPNAKAAANAGKSGQLVIGSNQLSNPVGLYGKDTQYTVAAPNKGKLSIKPNIGAATVITETVELMGVGADDTNATVVGTKGKTMPTGAWLRCRNDAANPVNVAFTLTDIPEGGAASGYLYSCVMNNSTSANPGQYNMYYTNITGGNETNTTVITMNPTNTATIDYTINAPPVVATQASLILSGNVVTRNNGFAGRVTTPAGLTTPAINITGLTTNAVIMLTCVGASNAGIFYTPIAGSFTITSTGAAATIAYQVIEL
jgi:hypothetical protein